MSNIKSILFNWARLKGSPQLLVFFSFLLTLCLSICMHRCAFPPPPPTHTHKHKHLLLNSLHYSVCVIDFTRLFLPPAVQSVNSF